MSRPNKRGVETAKKVYASIKLLGPKATVDRLIYVTNLPRRTLYYSLTRLVEKGFVAKERKGARVIYRAVKPFSEKKFVGEADDIPADEPPVYVYARKAKKIMERYGLEADLIGACKIHIATYPNHVRITRDVDMIVTREHANILVNALADNLNLKAYGGFGGVAYKLEAIDAPIGFDIYVDHIKEGSKPIWNLRKHLKKHGELLLEHALVAKLTRPDFDDRSDAYDIYVALPLTDLKTLAELTTELIQQSPEVADRIKRNLKILEEYVKREYPEQVKLTKDLIKRYLEKINEVNKLVASVLLTI